MKPRSLVIFSSLPEVGGHTTTTLKLCELLRPMFGDIRVLIKDIPGHGFSASAAGELSRTGVRIARCTGRLCLPGGRGRPDVFLAVGMRHLSPVLALLLRARQSFYYHITHELNPPVLRQLRIYSAFFSKLVFISPATARRYPARGAAVWAVQPTELAMRPGPAGARLPGPPRFGFLGRLTAEKGAGVLADLIEKSQAPCELHIAGRGPEEEALRRRQEKNPGRFFLHGAFAASERTDFLGRFFSGIDRLCVPSLDDREGIPNVILEALQFGVPVLATRTGGMRSFAMDELGPADPDVVRLVEPHELPEALSAASPPSPELRGRCREYYGRFFSDAVLASHWRKLLSIPAP
ncbi:MAG: glycosyltransferase family 4 protein [Verrucomicrobiae bacterium]